MPIKGFPPSPRLRWTGENGNWVPASLYRLRATSWESNFSKCFVANTGSSIKAMCLTIVQEIFKNLKGIYLFAEQKNKCQEKVWKREMGLGEEGKNLS